MQTLKNVVRALIKILGYEISHIAQECDDQQPDSPKFLRRLAKNSEILQKIGVTKAHYASGGHLLENGWVNIDRNPTCPDPSKLYMIADLTCKQPFPSDYFEFAFAEDFLEHLSQADSITFLSEVYRCLKIGGVLRLSFPGLPAVLRKHYRSSDYEGASTGKEEAYTMWGHHHFYTEESLSLVARHIGFSEFRSVQYGSSVHDELCNLDSREGQQGLNIYAEIIK